MYLYAPMITLLEELGFDKFEEWVVYISKANNSYQKNWFQNVLHKTIESFFETGYVNSWKRIIM